jgi:hypothetical protein
VLVYRQLLTRDFGGSFDDDDDDHVPDARLLPFVNEQIDTCCGRRRSREVHQMSFDLSVGLLCETKSTFLDQMLSSTTDNGRRNTLEIHRQFYTRSSASELFRTMNAT